MKTLIEIRRDLHRIPELGFQEVKTQNYLLEQISALPQERLTIIQWKTGIVVKIKGMQGKKTIGWRTDIDGLPITEATGLPFQSEHEEKMHACGHDVHMTVALGLLRKLVDNPVNDHVVLIFQPAEEGPGGALPMREWLKQEYPELVPEQIYAFHIAPEYPVGTVATRPGLLFANTSELFIDLVGKEGHAAFPHQAKDMSIAAATLLLQLQTIVSRSVNPMDPAVLTIGKMSSGTVQNIISGQARLEGTIRTMDAATMTTIKQKIESFCHAAEIAFDCDIRIDYGSSYYQVKNDETLANDFISFAKRDPSTTAIVCDAAMTGEDFGYFLQEIPGVLFWAGVESPFGLHHAKLNPNEAVIDYLVPFIDSYFRALSNK
ncbi:N-acetyldiaminopimelate deacetylase [Psychrobacillus lasiicapitis]|uniref:N-acetyldiaminopimelate deacetylase n=1 Tax=Psychrobacillus lasiicapitis TaxID=1636719 RepID=A0A544T516_9BACI|nr:N-acetyldiaminopimelate deacetylase [Psychrobacillus lasiicapitis]TQR12535.1 N-acetyldiaminopimelate deacetylase [Psychrobacillus lasiicapitis]GGA38927.1 N-acetyldiaminopimelate deacetylase [Psychrobacillus lasiicapitis]